MVEGLGFLERTVTVLGLNLSPQLTLVDAHHLEALHHPPFPPDVPAILNRLRSVEVAAKIKPVLRVVYPAKHPVQLVHFKLNGREDEPSPWLVEALTLDEIDGSQNIGLFTNLYLPPLGPATSFESFQEIVAHLRAPNGCPWDRKQTHQSLRSHLISETYEVLSALDAEDKNGICEELGDLLLQIVLHAQIAAEASEFTMSEVVHAIHTKIVRRHPHVFGDLELRDVDGVLRNWERLKADERAINGENGEKPKGLLDGVPLTLPALIQSQEYQERVERVGFAIPEFESLLQKMQAILHQISATGLSQQTEQIGELLFLATGLASLCKIDAESALREANARLRLRIGSLEDQAHHAGVALADLLNRV
jgi:tetrapyrrole methylase family protein/MazG family protein